MPIETTEPYAFLKRVIQHQQQQQQQEQQEVGYSEASRVKNVEMCMLWTESASLTVS